MLRAPPETAEAHRNFARSQHVNTDAAAFANSAEITLETQPRASGAVAL